MSRRCPRGGEHDWSAAGFCRKCLARAPERLRKRLEEDMIHGAVSGAFAKIAAVASGREELAVAIRRAAVAARDPRIGLGAGSGALDDLARLTAGLLGAVDDANTPGRVSLVASAMNDGWPPDIAVAAGVFVVPLDSRHRPSSAAVQALELANPKRARQELPNVPSEEKALRAWVDRALQAAARLAADNQDDFYRARFRTARQYMASFDPLAPIFLAD